MFRTPIQVPLARMAAFLAFYSWAAAADEPDIPPWKDVTLFHPRLEVAYSEDFEGDLSQWVVEQVEGGSVKIIDGSLDIDDAGGCTVWFRPKLSAPLMIEYDVLLVRAGGSHDEVSDLNCFWMAIDPGNPDDIFQSSEKRGGRFSNYHGLRLYYVGYGANRNTTTRFRRYTGTGERPLLPEHDLSDRKYMHRGNEWLRIQLVVVGSHVQYLRDGEVVFDFVDSEPYHEGWFGFRTVRNHMKIDNFRVCRLAGKRLQGEALVNNLIKQAGIAGTDEERLALLRLLSGVPEIDESLRKDVERLIAEVEQWISASHLPYFGRTIGKGEDYDFGIPQDSPLYPLTYFYQARMITWYSNEMGPIWLYPEKKRQWMDRACVYFEKAREAFPENRITRMYLGEAIPPKVEYPAVAGAPEWAVAQREGLERLTDIIEWWVDNRQREDGSYGGGWGDDVEMWRHWVPVMIGFESPKMTTAQALLSNAVMSQPHMENGYTKHVYDVQHTAEDSSDSITPMMHLEPENEVWSQRALRLADLMENLWTGTNQRGFLQFKSTYFSSERVDDNPQWACDHFYILRAVQPTLLYWQRTGDERLTNLFSTWMDTWVDAAEREERGKPAGIIPNAIHWPDGRIGGLEDPWWDPRNHSQPTIYRWPKPLQFMTQTLLLTYHMTADEKYLEPLRHLARVRLRYLRTMIKDLPEPGSELWCGSKLGGLAESLAKYAFLTGSDEFDELLRAESAPYVRFRLQNELDPLEGTLGQLAEDLRYNWPGYTREVRYTDRVFTFPRILAQNAMFPEAQPHSHTPRVDILYSAVTGDPGSADYFPLNAVRWLTLPRDIAVLVTDSATDTFGAQLFHFGGQPRSMSAEFYLLNSGNYVYELTGHAEGNALTEGKMTVSGSGTRISFELPSRTLCELRIRRSQGTE